MKQNKTVDIQKEVNPKFRDVWTTNKPYNILRGGRNSFKSSVIALLLVFMMIPYISAGHKVNAVVIRKVANTIRDSVFLKIQWALEKFGLLHEFKIQLTPFRITHRKTGSTFYFYGQDDFQKLKSNDIGDIIAVWYEEAAEFTDAEEFDQTNITFMRQKAEVADMVRFFWSYNPPRNPYSWINEWFDNLMSDPNFLTHSSSYLDDELNFVTDQMLDEINRIKENDYDYYRYLYLGEAVGLGTNIYNMSLFQPLSNIPDNDYLIGLYFSTDTGHQVSATATLAFGITQKRNVILLDTSFYSPKDKVIKRAPSEHTVELQRFYTAVQQRYGVPIYKKTIDSAEGGIRNEYFLKYGERLHAVAKGKKVDLIDYTHDLLAHKRFFYLDIDANKIFVEECKKYQWNSKSLITKPDNPDVIKENDDTIDAFQYFVKDNLAQLGLKY